MISLYLDVPGVNPEPVALLDAGFERLEQAVRGGLNHVQNLVKAIARAVIGVGDLPRWRIGHSVEEQRNGCARAFRPEALERAEIRVIHREDDVKALEILGPHLARA